MREGGRVDERRREEEERGRWEREREMREREEEEKRRREELRQQKTKELDAIRNQNVMMKESMQASVQRRKEEESRLEVGKFSTFLAQIHSTGPAPNCKLCRLKATIMKLPTQHQHGKKKIFEVARPHPIHHLVHHTP